MNRVIVIGCPGAGKSTFARRLRDKTGLPLYYLDMLWHRADRTTVSAEEFDGELEKILNGEKWIIDGNYLRTMPARLEACDTVFFLDYPLALCLESARARIGTAREDLPWVEQEFDEEFRQWILDFPETQLPEIRRLLQLYGPGRSVHIFKNRDDADRFLACL
ncbi:MAG: adenylate kinase [Pyramidobacter sp.]|jgi:adenylate kinase family enzyme